MAKRKRKSRTKSRNISTPSHTNSKQCHTCKEIILKDAVKCKHCGVFQNWRRYFNLVYLLIAAIAFLIANIFGGLDYIKAYLHVPKSTLEVFGEEFKPHINELTFKIKNSGDKPGIFVKAEFRCIYMLAGQNYNVIFKFDDVNKVIDGGGLLIVDYKMRKTLHAISNVNSKDYEIELNKPIACRRRYYIKEFNGKVNEVANLLAASYLEIDDKTTASLSISTMSDGLNIGANKNHNYILFDLDEIKTDFLVGGKIVRTETYNLNDFDRHHNISRGKVSTSY